MSCMCGDICCPSCGPAQGNGSCPVCRAWVSEGCEHFDENGNILPEFAKVAEQSAADEYAWWLAYAKDVLDPRD